MPLISSCKPGQPEQSPVEWVKKAVSSVLPVMTGREEVGVKFADDWLKVFPVKPFQMGSELGNNVMTIRALFFDVFGTLVDWRGSIAREVRRLGLNVDGEAFADAWRAEYQPAMQIIRSGSRGYVKLDTLHRENLDRILPRFGLDAMSEAERVALNLVWHRLDAWPDVVEGLKRLRGKFRLAPMSNGNISLMADMARHNGFVWDAVLGSEIARDYKPKAGVYLAGCAAFDFEPGDCMMVAAHTDDLVAAAASGLKTAHIARPDEFGPGKGEHGPSAPVGFAARDLLHLAEQLGA